MSRASQRRSLTDRLKHENEELRDAGRQLLAGLTEYAKKQNWASVPSQEPGGGPMFIWIGDGDGPKIARHYLGLDTEEN